MGFRDQLAHAWNAFVSREQKQTFAPEFTGSFGAQPERRLFRMSNERSIITAIYTRVSIDYSMIDMRHVKLDKNQRYTEDVNSGLNNCLTLEANIDQGSLHFKRNTILSLFDEGTIAIVPINTTVDPETNAFDIDDWRIGRIVQWYPRHVRVDVYNDENGRHQEITLAKRAVGIVENPLYAVMNEPNSTLQRLIRKLNLLDSVDEQTSSGKLDMIIQLPYQTRSDIKKEQARQRRKDIEFQLTGSQYGIAYIDANEKITQLNRPAENNLLKQIEYLTEQLYSHLGITAEVMNGTADEKTMLNYMSRTIEPLLEAVAEEIKRKFLSKTARTQGHSIEYFRDPFKLVPLSVLAEIVDKMTRNEVLTSNEVRQFIGMKPSLDPKADELRNSNMPAPMDTATGAPATPSDDEEDDVSGVFDEVNATLDSVFEDLGVPPDDDEDAA